MMRMVSSSFKSTWHAMRNVKLRVTSKGGAFGVTLCPALPFQSALCFRGFARNPFLLENRKGLSSSLEMPGRGTTFHRPYKEQ